MTEVIVNDDSAPEEKPEEIAEEVVEESEEKWQRELELVREGLTAQGQALGTIAASLELLSARLPENLNSLIQSQQEMIQSQNRELMETVRSLLTPPPPPPEVIQEPVAEVVPEVAAIPVVEEKPFHRRRRI